MKPCAMEMPPDACRLLIETLARVGDKWSMLTILSLENGEMRFNSLRRRIDGISQKMLTVTLRGLERDRWSRPKASLYRDAARPRTCCMPSAQAETCVSISPSEALKLSVGTNCPVENVGRIATAVCSRTVAS